MDEGKYTHRISLSKSIIWRRGFGQADLAFRLATTHQNAPMDERPIYHSDPEIMRGTPVFTGSRVPVDRLILKARDSLDGFPDGSREQVEAFLERAQAEALEVTPQEASA